ncbi:MAG TPA: GNAT family N-acetyltransferase [Candidatus Saccharimonadales bacterium]|nr:GNAT family N-acetyltransferase [Candidatus Saccharimonadales bacterium]
MTDVYPEINFVKIDNPEMGDDIAEQTARLILLGTYDTPEPTEQELRETLDLELGGKFALAAINSGGDVVGTGGLLLVEEEPDKSALILNLVVAPKERGRGLGIKIISMLEEEASRLNATETFGQPHPDYVGFYEKLGYRTGKKPHLKGDIVFKPI